MNKFSELCINKVTEVIKSLNDLGIWELWINELHLSQLFNDGDSEGLLDEGHRNLLLALLTFEKNLLAALIISDNTLHHSNGLWKWAVVVVVRESILLQELILDQLGHLEGCLLVLTEGVLSDQLHNFDKIVLLLQDVLDGNLVSHEVWVSSIIIFLKSSIVVRVGNVPVDGWEMLSLSELLIQSPEDLYDIEGSSSNWIREITTWWGHGSDNRNRTNTRWGSEASNLTSSLVELSQLRTQMCWETRISGHLCKTSRDLSESLSPS